MNLHKKQEEKRKEGTKRNETKESLEKTAGETRKTEASLALAVVGARFQIIIIIVM